MKKSLIDLVSPNIKALITPIVVLVVLTLLTIISYRIAYDKLSLQRDELTKAKSVEKILQDKEKVLTQVEGQVSGYVDSVVVSLPDKNPAIVMVSQIKNLALSKGITFNSIKGGSESTTPGVLSSVDIILGAEGTTVSLIDFLKALKTVAPLSTIERVKINQSTGSARAEIAVRTYFSAFPEKLPSMTEPVKDLTADEKETLGKLSQLIRPTFVNLTPQAPVIRESPFD